MPLTDNEKWNAVVHCDPSFDGIFFYGVRTTGIFCRPSCKSKEPLRRNVVFFDDIEKARTSGLRPCKRCRPDLIEFKPMRDLIEKAKQIFDTYFADPSRLAAEIEKLGISQSHFIYLFRQQFHMRPVEYINKLRVKKAAQLIATTEANILNVALLCGFGSLSNFYELFKRHAGLTPKEYRKSKGMSGVDA